MTNTHGGSAGRRRRGTLVGAALVVALGLGLPGGATAQGLQYTEVSDAHFVGGLGKVASFAAKLGGGNTNAKTTHTYYITPTKMRTDDGDSTSMIIDTDAEKYIWVDHHAKAYYVLTFQEAIQRFKAAMQQMQAKMDSAQQEIAQAKQQQAANPDNAKLTAQAHLNIQETGKHDNISGYDASESYVTVGIDATVTSNDKETGEQKSAQGNMTLFEDMWLAKSVPLQKYETEFHANLAKKLGSEVSVADKMKAMQTMKQVFGDPRMREAMQKASEESKKLQGTPLRTTAYFVLVPEGATFDSQLALQSGQEAQQPEQKKKGGGLGALLKAAMNAQSNDQQQQKQADQQEAKPQQATLMVSTVETTSIKEGAIAASMFEPPAGYKEVQPPADFMGS
jgi:hypothetical protein